MTSVNERQYQIPFCQLLSAEGESVIDISTHHPHEKGKDIVTVLPNRKVRAYQLKAGRINLSTWCSIEGQINNLVELPVEHRRWHGLHEYETHRVPVGAMILDAKYCEFCGCNFLRRARSKDRYCSKCLLTIPTLNAPQAEKLVSELIH